MTRLTAGLAIDVYQGRAHKHYTRAVSRLKNGSRLWDIVEILRLSYEHEWLDTMKSCDARTQAKWDDMMQRKAAAASTDG